jgi:phage tail protein X
VPHADADTQPHSNAITITFPDKDIQPQPNKAQNRSSNNVQNAINEQHRRINSASKCDAIRDRKPNAIVHPRVGHLDQANAKDSLAWPVYVRDGALVTHVSAEFHSSFF